MQRVAAAIRAQYPTSKPRVDICLDSSRVTKPPPKS